MQRILSLLCTVVFSVPVFAADIVGNWQGKLQIQPGMALTLVLHIEQQQAQLSATLDSVDQGAFGIPVSSISFNQSTLDVQIQAIGASYQATLNAETLNGTFTQGGNAFELILTRQSAEQIAAEQRARHPQEPQPPFPYREQEVQIPHLSAGFNLAGTLTLPPEGGPFVAAILVTGSGPQDRDETLMGHKPFKLIADFLTRHGYAVLRVDDRGIGQSGGQFNGASLQDFTSDIASAYAYLRSRSDILPQKIGLIGHSEGGMTAPMFAASQPDVAFVILLAGLGVEGQVLWAEQQRDLVAVYAPAIVDKVFALQTEAGALAAQGADSAKIAAVMQQLPNANDAMVNQYTAMLSSAWGRSFMAYKPAEYLPKLRMPILAINGDKDIQVNAEHNLGGIRQLTSANKDVTTRQMPGLNHLLQKAHTGLPAEYGTLTETVNPAVLELMQQWLDRRFRG